VFIGAWNNFLWPFLINDTSLMTLPVGCGGSSSAYGVQYARSWPGRLATLPPSSCSSSSRQIVTGVATSGFGGQ
jgi:multiple sugar transport system permease protein